MSIVLRSTTESLQVVLDSAPATNQLPCIASYADVGGTVADNATLTTGTTAATIVAAPASGVSRVISGISIPNIDTATRIVTVTKLVSATSYQIIKASLPTGSQLYFDNATGWKVLDSSANVITSSNTPGRLLNIQTFFSSGTYTPTSGTNSVIVTVIGGGGGGGGCAACTALQAAAAGGGGGGGMAKSRLTSGFSGATVTVGSGGAAGAAGANAGGTGGTSSFGGLLSATGGVGGAGGSAIPLIAITSAGSLGGVGSGGNLFNLAGNPSTTAFVLSINSTVGGAGGSSYLGTGGIQRASLGGVIVGAPGSGWGGGASGTTISTLGAATAGAVGAQGICLVEEYS